MIRVARGVGLRDEAAERQAADDRADDPEGVAKAFHIVRPLPEVPGRGIVAFTASVAAVVVEDDLRDIREACEGLLETRVIEAWSAVQHEQGGLLAHAFAVRNEARVGDVNEESNIIDLNEHD